MYPRSVVWGVLLPAAVLFAVQVPGCSREKEPAEPEGPDAPGSAAKPAKSSLRITSTAFSEGASIPDIFTCTSRNVSPPLQWKGVPEKTKSLVLICDDPDAPRKTWVHWVIYDLPPKLAGLPEGVPKTAKLPSGGVQGTNDFHKIGYDGPCPPRGGAHRYFFKLFALDATLNLKPGATKAAVVKAMKGHVLAKAQLMGKYKR